MTIIIAGKIETYPVDTAAERPLCAAGMACERLCPFVRHGQECPDVADAEAECNEQGLTLWDVLLRTEQAAVLPL